MTHYTMAYVPGVVRCEDLEATLLAAAVQQLAMIVEEDPTEVFEEDDGCSWCTHWDSDDEDDEDDQDYQDYLDWVDYIEQGYD